MGINNSRREHVSIIKYAYKKSKSSAVKNYLFTIHPPLVKLPPDPQSGVLSMCLVFYLSHRLQKVAVQSDDLLTEEKLSD